MSITEEAIPARSEVESQELETVRHAFVEAQGVVRTLLEWANALDAKIAAVFTLSTTIAGLVPILSLLSDRTSSDWVVWLWGAGGALWVATSFSCIRAYRVQSFIVGITPCQLEEKGWLNLTEFFYLSYRLEDMGTQAKSLRCNLDNKAGWLGWSLRMLTLQIIVLAIAVVGYIWTSEERLPTHPCEAEKTCLQASPEEG